MICTFGAPLVESTLAGDEVSSRRVRFGSQPEQIMFLRRMVDQYRAVAAIRARARDIVFRQRECRPRDELAHALAIAGWVQDTITYVREIPETFQTPTTTVATGYGDCDDFSTLIASLCESIGIETELVGLEWPGPGGQRAFHHIFPRALVRRGGAILRVPLDATLTTPVTELRDPVRIALEQGRGPLRTFIA